LTQTQKLKVTNDIVMWSGDFLSFEWWNQTSTHVAVTHVLLFSNTRGIWNTRRIARNHYMGSAWNPQQTGMNESMNYYSSVLVQSSFWCVNEYKNEQVKSRIICIVVVVALVVALIKKTLVPHDAWYYAFIHYLLIL